MFGLKRGFKKVRGGVAPGHFKHTKDLQSAQMPTPKTVHIFMAQHIGAPCTPTVSVGDQVKVGDVIGMWEGFLGAPIHSSVSGKVTSIEPFVMPNAARTTVVNIEADGKQEVSELVQKPQVTDRDSFIEAVKNSGLVGLGGAGFPTWVKLSPKNLNEVDTLLINAAECEPYLTADYREMMENGQNVIDGIGEVLRHLNLKKAIIGIEENKPEAIAHLQELAKGNEHITVQTLVARYPQGAEKVLIAEATGRIVPEGKLPADVGVIVMNVTTVSFIFNYLQTGMPLVQKRVTVDGDCVKTPQNVLVPVGTKIADIVAFCGGYDKETAKILLGGPMMGTAVYSDEYPIAKNTNGLLFFSLDKCKDETVLACIRCGKCAGVCPMGLMPPMIADADKTKNIDDLKKLKANLCMECGCCTYICPSKRPVTQAMRGAKATLREMGK